MSNWIPDSLNFLSVALKLLDQINLNRVYAYLTLFGTDLKKNFCRLQLKTFKINNSLMFKYSLFPNFCIVNYKYFTPPPPINFK